jgi:hypothetical protein
VVARNDDHLVARVEKTRERAKHVGEIVGDRVEQAQRCCFGSPFGQPIGLIVEIEQIAVDDEPPGAARRRRMMLEEAGELGLPAADHAWPRPAQVHVADDEKVGHEDVSLPLEGTQL